MARKDALTGKAAASPEEAAAPAWLLFDFAPQIETLFCPGRFAPHEVVMVCNQSDREVLTTALPDLFAEAIQSWTFKLKDGSPAPITADAISSLPSDLLGWLVREWQARRASPLVVSSNGSGKPTTSPPNGNPSPATAS